MKNNYTRNDLVMHRPSSSFGNRWRDGTPIGNGKTGILLYGGCAAEHFIVNRYDLWYSGSDAPVPDMTDCLKKMREIEKTGDLHAAHAIMYNALLERHYGTTLADMRALGMVNMIFSCPRAYSHYRRVLHMDTAEAEITYNLGEASYRRRAFVSRLRDVTVMEAAADENYDLRITSGFFQSNEGGREDALRRLNDETAVYRVENGCYCYAAKNDDNTYYGVVCRVLTDGSQTVTEKEITISDSRRSLLLIKVFSEEKDIYAAMARSTADLQDCPDSYDTLLSETLPLYQPLYMSADMEFYDGEFHTNEELIADTAENSMSPELAEKLWRFGRYLFISGTCEDGFPFPLYGVWPCGYEHPFTHNVANENVQCLYWHTEVGGLASLDVPLIHYYCDNLDSFRENARQLYGCRGIFVGTYTTPRNKAVAWYVPVILHFNGCAGWLSSHFYRYYKFSGDETLFREKILPFMVETAAFYEDFHTLDENGKLMLYPAVSPENSPVEFHNPSQPHPMPVTKNPTIEMAILKELLTNLLREADHRLELAEKVPAWRDMLDRIPEYKINEDGAIAEWIDDRFHDDYAHRHISHLYPVFPGTEFDESGLQNLKSAFAKAIDLRKPGSLNGWSLPHMANVYARLDRPEQAFQMINDMAKVCVYGNLFTSSFDYRDMGITGYDCGSEYMAPIQFDALVGSVSSMQEMILLVTPGKLRLLPACPTELNSGRATLHFYTGTIRMTWDLTKRQCHGEIIAERDTDITLELPFGQPAEHVVLRSGETFGF